MSQNNCHTNENNWWKDDAHKVTVDAFYDDPASYEKIAKLAGVDPANMLKGNNQCMSCHGTVVAGKEAREVEEGVSCESCHGAGSGYKDPHSEGQAGQGLNRIGYKKGLQLGMVENKNVEVRGKTCVKCHYITDQKLISAGHPDGARFNYVSGIKKVAKHWKRPPGDGDINKAPFEKAMSAKGPVAQIAKVEAAAAPATPPAAVQDLPEQPAVNQPATNQTARNPAVNTQDINPAAATDTPASTATAPAAAASNTQVAEVKEEPLQQIDRKPASSANTFNSRGVPALPATTTPQSTAIDPMMLPADTMGAMILPPFPQISDSASIRDVLIILKKRLELLHQRTGVK